MGGKAELLSRVPGVEIHHNDGSCKASAMIHRLTAGDASKKSVKGLKITPVINDNTAMSILKPALTTHGAKYQNPTIPKSRH
jgi:hypothetical protein